MMWLWLLFSCQGKDDGLDEAANLKPVYSIEETLEFPQRSAEWWGIETDDINIVAGAGVMFGDVNSDGVLDIVHLRRSGVHIHMRNSSTSEEWMTTSFDELEGIPASGAMLDWDKDGDVDLLINMVYGPDLMWYQEQGQWELRTLESPVYGTGNAWYDVNKDGRLDFVTAGYGDDTSMEFYEAMENGQPYAGESNSLYLQTDSGHFEVSTIPTSQIEGFTFMPSFLPYFQGDSWDLLVVNDFGQVNGGHQLYRIEEGAFVEQSAGHGLDIGMNGMGIDATDINDDLIPDVFITNIIQPVFLVSSPYQTWIQSAAAYGLNLLETQEVCWGVDWYDVNNDGHEDLWVGCGPIEHPDSNIFTDSPSEQPDALFLWTQEGFVDVVSAWGSIEQTIHVAGDLSI